MKNKNVFLIITLTILLHAGSFKLCFSQETQRNILAGFTPDAIQNALPAYGAWKPFPTTASMWQSQYSPEILQQIIKGGEEVLKKDYPYIPASIVLDFVRIGDHKTRYEKLFFEKREMLWTAVMAEAVEGKGRFTDKIVDGVWSICEETFWGTTSILYMQKAGLGLPDAEDPVVDLYAPETAALLAWVDYLHGSALDRVSPMIRKRIHYEVNRRVFEPMLKANYFYLKAEKPNNWVPWIMSNYINAQLLLEKDVKKRNEAIAFAVRYINKYLNGLGPDGGCDEGVGYWAQAVGCVFDALQILHDASSSKLDVFKNPFIQKMGSYIYKMHIGGNYYVNIGDAMPQSTPNALLLFRYGEATRDTGMQGFASWVLHNYYDMSKAPFFNSAKNGKARALYNMAALKKCIAYPPVIPENKDMWIEDIQVMSARAPDGMFVAAYGGNNAQSHNHNDVGNFLVYYKDEPIIIDVGPGSYTSKTFSDQRYTLWFNTSPYHNLPIINGYAEAPGKQYVAKNVHYIKSANQAVFDLDIAGCYPLEAGINSWKRTIRLDKTKGAIKVSDNYETASPLKSHSQTLMTVCETEIGTPGKVIFHSANGKNVVMSYNAENWNINKEKLPLNGNEDKMFKESWKGKSIWKVNLVSKSQLSSKGTINYFFEAEK